MPNSSIAELLQKALTLHLKSFLAANHVQFAGFILEASIRRQFDVRFADPGAATDLDCWHAFERDAPQSFAGMYQFWVRKRQ